MPGKVSERSRGPHGRTPYVPSWMEDDLSLPVDNPNRLGYDRLMTEKNAAAVELGRKGGQSTSAAKAAAARANGAKGGRPRDEDRIIYNPMVARRCPRCNKTNTCFTEGGRTFPHGPSGPVVENTKAHRTIICTNCGHKWRGKLTKSERGSEEE